jgi:hypothetical protein
MTEASWQACGDPHEMLDYLLEHTRLTDRKLRLFACACCRRIWQLLKDPRSRTAVEVAEAYTDGRASPEDLSNAAAEAREVEPSTQVEQYIDSAEDLGRKARLYVACAAACVAGSLRERTAASYVQGAVYWSAVLDAQERASERAIFAFLRSSYTSFVPAAARVAARESERSAQADLLRDIVGNPFAPASPLEPALLHWQGGLVPQLALACYEHRALPAGILDPLRLAVLADALEEAGCRWEGMLTHLRGPGPHTRGCHVLDLLLGKE